jgi:hypothetical protein
MIKIAHILNPVKIADDSDFYKIQQKTLISIIQAKKYIQHKCVIDLMYVDFEGDCMDIQDEFLYIGSLCRSVESVNPNLTCRKLPVFQDLLNKAKPYLKGYDVIIYSNMDIILLPFFYEYILEQYQLGHDAVVINRRRVPFQLLRDQSLVNTYSTLGRSHPGFDCFAFSYELLNQFDFHEICLGIPFFEVSFVHQIAAHSKNPKWSLDLHLTVHLGLSVFSNRNSLYYQHNRSIYFKKVLPSIKPKLKLSNFPYFHRNFLYRAISWGLNPSIFFSEYIELQQNSWCVKARLLLQEIRWRILQR